MRRALLVIVALLSSSSACGPELSDSELFAGSDQSGSVRVALSATHPDGSTYLLRDSTLEVSGSVLLTLTSRASHDDALTTPLPSGRYGAFLRPGFHVVKLEADGRERVVEARLVSPNPQRFALEPFEDASLRLTFAVGSEELVFGAPPELRVTRAD